METTSSSAAKAQQSMSQWAPAMRLVVAGTPGGELPEQVALGQVELDQGVGAEPAEVEELAGVGEAGGVARGGRICAQPL
ncbi:hypothetical protein GCM10020001_009280 [Nonomuraea salmonea]